MVGDRRIFETGCASAVIWAPPGHLRIVSRPATKKQVSVVVARLFYRLVPG